MTRWTHDPISHKPTLTRLPPTPTPHLHQPVLGTMTFGWAKASNPVDEAVAAQMLDTFLTKGGREIDGARMYAEGESEAILQRALSTLPHTAQELAQVASKANPDREAGGSGMGGLSAEGVSSQINASLQALDSEAMDLFYLHWPDSETRIDETLEATQRAYEAGRFQRLGLSNFSVEEVKNIHTHMSERGWVVPTVYQGMYNALTRDVEDELLPALRSLGMSFYAYNPLAGGLLTGKHAYSGKIADGRFSDNEWYQKRYWKNEYFSALNNAKTACETSSVPMAEAALRWLAHHSQLDAAKGDAIILGASSVGQLEANLNSCTAGPLPSSVTGAWDEAWDVSKTNAPAYASYGTSGSSVIKRVEEVKLLNEGKQLDVTFGSRDRFRLHTGWMFDSSPQSFTSSYVRRDTKEVLSNTHLRAESATVSSDGKEVTVVFRIGDSVETVERRFDSAWLSVSAPFVGQSQCGAPTKEVKTDGHLIDTIPRTTWTNEYTMTDFDATELVESEDAQMAFFETLARDGFCTVTNLDKPNSLDIDEVALPLNELASRVVGKFYTHPRRRTSHGVMRKQMATAAAADSLVDYNLGNPLSMHTDHAFIAGVPGYLQFMMQAQGSVVTKIVDGFAVAEYLRETDPEAFKILSTANFTHSLRTIHYDRNGDYCHLGSQHEGVFEDCHTHPILTLDDQGEVMQVAHSETKRGVCALPYEQYQPAMEAYTKWLRLIEDERFVKHVPWPEHSVIVCNNHRVLHGRASQPTDGTERCMVWAYAHKHVIDCRYRLLRQRQVENQGVSDEWTTRLPNELVRDLSSPVLRVRS
mmetsp:Transcript_46159/g.128625  ORF Transcript_46159/g.128625 Transcript_46159/m.128625 type:complete len:813 (+) Transcript_46159:2472-4910(+)